MSKGLAIEERTETGETWNPGITKCALVGILVCISKHYTLKRSLILNSCCTSLKTSIISLHDCSFIKLSYSFTLYSTFQCFKSSG